MKTTDVAHKHLSNDPVMKILIDTYELPGWSYEKNFFLELVGSIIGQQLSVKAGDTIEKRFHSLFAQSAPTPENILKVSDETMRNCGLSYRKIQYIKGVCEAVVVGEIDLENMRQWEDKEIIEKLITLKGVGRWTAEMFLMVSFGREDVFSLGDLGLRNAVARLYNVDRDDLQAIEKISQQWRPYRSLASRYLWKSLDNTPKT